MLVTLRGKGAFYIADKNVNHYNHHGDEYGDSSKKYNYKVHSTQLFSF